MPTLTREEISKVSQAVLRAAGAPEGHARIVGEHLADANLAGHDSHGFIRIPQYVQRINEGLLAATAEPEVIRETPGMAQVNGHATFGQVVATFAAELAIEKAGNTGVALVTMSNLDHTGRIGTYAEMAARTGMAAIVCTGFWGRAAAGVAPFGGREGKLGTNPISISFPFAPEGTLLLDYATSMAAEGKLRVYRARGEQLPEEWVLSKEGKPSRDPNDFYDGGAILPMGGMTGGHKGYALSFMVSLLGGVLGQLGSERSRMAAGSGTTIIVVNVGALASEEEIRGEVETFVNFVKETPPWEGSRGVLYPGEIEDMTRSQRLVSGVEIEDATWDEVQGLVREFGLEEELAAVPAGV